MKVRENPRNAAPPLHTWQLPGAGPLGGNAVEEAHVAGGAQERKRRTVEGAGAKPLF